MAVKIGWTLISDVGSSMFFDPLPEGEWRKPASIGLGVSGCPAVRLYEARTYVIRSPYSIRLRGAKAGTKWSIRPVYPDTEVEESRLRTLIEVQPAGAWRSAGVPVLQLSLPYVFFADELVLLNQLEAPQKTGSRNWSLIRGRFNICDWQRPINWSVEWTDPSVDLFIRRGQPIFSVSFDSVTPEGTVILRRYERTPALDRAIAASTGVAKMTKGTFRVIKEAGRRIREPFFNE